MEWLDNSPNEKLTLKELAEEILQLYIQGLQDHTKLKKILSDYPVLDYFGEYFHGYSDVTNYIFTNLNESSYDMASVKGVGSLPAGILAETLAFRKPRENEDDDLGVALISPPRPTIESQSLTTPPSNPPSIQPGGGIKRSAREACLEEMINGLKMSKMRRRPVASCSRGAYRSRCLGLSPSGLQMVFPTDLLFLSAHGTIRYPRKRASTSDPKRAKHHSLGSPRDRFCQLCIWFQPPRGPLVPSGSDCRIWMIRYHISSRAIPRNLLTAFNEAEDI